MFFFLVSVALVLSPLQSKLNIFEIFISTTRIGSNHFQIILFFFNNAKSSTFLLPKMVLFWRSVILHFLQIIYHVFCLSLSFNPDKVSVRSMSWNVGWIVGPMLVCPPVHCRPTSNICHRTLAADASRVIPSIRNELQQEEYSLLVPTFVICHFPCVLAVS